MLQHLTASKVILSLGIAILLMQSNLPQEFLNQAFAQAQGSYQDQLDNSIHNKLKENDQPSHKSQFLSNLDISSPDKIPNQNLYLRTLNSFTKELTPSVYEGMSLVTDLSASEIAAVIEFDNLSPLQTTASSVSQTQSSYRNLLALYQQEKSFFVELAKIRHQAAVYEIFTDNNSQNSGFDLLTDLNKIEEQLFQESTPNTIAYSDPNRSDFWNNYNSQPFVSTFSPVNFTSFSSSKSSDPNTEAPSDSSSQEQSPNQGLDPTPAYQFPAIQYGAVCQVDPSLKQELDIFQSESENQPDNQDSTQDQTSTGQNGNQASETSQTQNSLPSLPQQIAAYQSKPFQVNFSNQGQSCAPDQVFCFTRELKFNTAGLLYPEGSDCVSCIINRLNQNLQLLLDKGVLPQKITGNFGEPALCKKASYGDIGLNLNIFSKPILPSLPNPDLIRDIDPNFSENLLYQQNAVSNNGFSITNDTQTQNSLDLLSQNNAKQFISKFDSSLTAEFANNSYIAQVIESQDQHFDSISEQINTLNLYFEAFNTSLDQMNLNYIELINLPECSAL